MAKRKHICICLVLLLLVSGSALHAQLFQQKWKIGPEYEIDHVVKPGDEAGKGEVEVSLKVPYDEILFVKNHSNYKGRFDISIMIFRNGEQCVSENWIEDLSLNEFSMTNSRKNAFEVRRSYQLEPGTYRLEVLVTDLNTQNRRKREKEIDMSRLADGPWMLGDLYVVKEKSVRSEGGEMPEAIYVGFTAAGVKGNHHFKYILFSGDKPVKQVNLKWSLKRKSMNIVFRCGPGT
ncbi:MAG: hypothetical protein U5N26_10555 [Candidatus Marinimicrobia bacterium]|nr:hypothetical protein [Candidatus Neomarinimicrobiota bacterium]